MNTLRTRIAGWAGRIDREVVKGVLQGTVIGLLVLLALPQTRALLNPPPPLAQKVAAPAIERRLDLRGTPVSDDVLRVARWVVAQADNGDRHFAIVDKRAAQVLVFEPGGRLAGATPVLLGHAAGDDTVPGIGQRPIDQVLPEERTTPAGRFVARSGKNALGEDVVWVDYDAAVSMHRVRATNPAERRLERLASPTADDNRISWGCINMPPAFFEQVLWPAMGTRRGIVYVLPEHKALAAVFPGAAAASVEIARR